MMGMGKGEEQGIIPRVRRGGEEEGGGIRDGVKGSERKGMRDSVRGRGGRYSRV